MESTNVHTPIGIHKLNLAFLLVFLLPQQLSHSKERQTAIIETIVNSPVPQNFVNSIRVE